jgi:hypothetical protein
MLGLKGKLNVDIQGKNVVVTAPAIQPEELPCQYAYTLKIPGAEFIPE